MITSIEDEVRATMSTAAGFLSERQDYLHVFVTKSPGHGWDVVVRVDGSYSSKAWAEAAAGGIRQWMEGLTDVRHDKRRWWQGPPWKR